MWWFSTTSTMLACVPRISRDGEDAHNEWGLRFQTGVAPLQPLAGTGPAHRTHRSCLKTASPSLLICAHDETRPNRPALRPWQQRPSMTGPSTNCLNVMAPGCFAMCLSLPQMYAVQSSIRSSPPLSVRINETTTGAALAPYSVRSSTGRQAWHGRRHAVPPDSGNHPPLHLSPPAPKPLSPRGACFCGVAPALGALLHSHSIAWGTRGAKCHNLGEQDLGGFTRDWALILALVSNTRETAPWSTLLIDQSRLEGGVVEDLDGYLLWDIDDDR